MVDRSPAGLEIRLFHIGLSDDLAELLRSDASAHTCWCMWFIDAVKDFHAAGSDGNRARFEGLARVASEPMGLLAYRAGQPVGWCAVGPKERFARALRTPTLRGYVSPQKKTWFVPCFFVHPGHRRSGVTTRLLERAVSLAAEHGAELVAGFPAAGSRPASSGDRQIGTEGVFASQGFVVVHRPSGNRVVMQRDVGGDVRARPRMQAISAPPLLLEPLAVRHAQEMFPVLSDPAIYEFENEPPASEEDLARRYAILEGRRSRDGTQAWLNWVIRLQSGRLAGYVQATVFKSGAALIAYELASRHWRQGIGSTAVTAMLAELRLRYAVSLCVAVLKARNYRSEALLRKLGFEPASAEQVSAFDPQADEVVMVKTVGDVSRIGHVMLEEPVVSDHSPGTGAGR